MKETVNNVITLFLLVLGSVVFVYLLWFGKIGPVQFTLLFVVCLLFLFLLPIRNRLKELDIKNLRATLNEMKDVREDIYAKTETVKKLAEEIAELTAFNVTRVGRVAPPDLTEEMCRCKDEIVSILKMIGSDKNKIESITSPIDNTVLFDLKNNIVSKVRNQILHSSPTEEAAICEKAVKIFPDGHKQHATLQVVCSNICKEVDDILKNYNLNDSREILIQFLEKKGVPVKEIIPLIDRLDRFIKEKTL